MELTPVRRIHVKGVAQHNQTHFGTGVIQDLAAMATAVNKAVDMEMDLELMHDLGIFKLYRRCLESGFYEDDPKYLEIKYGEILPPGHEPWGPYRVQEIHVPTTGGYNTRYRIVSWDAEKQEPKPFTAGPPVDRKLGFYYWKDPNRAQAWVDAYNQIFWRGMLCVSSGEADAASRKGWGDPNYAKNYWKLVTTI